MKWIKASEKDMKDMGRKHWRCGKDHKPLSAGVAYNLFFKLKGGHPIEFLDESPVQGVEEAAHHYADKNDLDDMGYHDVEKYDDRKKGFIAGASWQQSQSNAGEQNRIWDEIQTLIFNAGSGQLLRNGTKEELKQKYSVRKINQ